MPYCLDRYSLQTVKITRCFRLTRVLTDPVAAALANAVVDAIGLRGRDLPLSPDRVFQALAEGAAEQPG